MDRDPRRGPGRSATRPPATGRTPATWTSSSPSWTTKSPARGCAGTCSRPGPPRRHRSTRRRQDAPDLPRRKVSARTVGKTYTAPDGKTFRPSMFLTLTCPSYGRVRDDGTPADPGSYDYGRAARDALHFAALFDRFIQNLRRFLGYDVQYFAAVEPQRRLAPHIHIAMRGTVSRAELRRVLAATYHQVWWPDTTAVRFDGDERPVWDEQTCTYVDPYTGEVLPTWDQALDAIGDEDEPVHVARFGDRFDAQGVLSGSKDAARCIGYLTKYLTKQVADCHQADTDAAARPRSPAGRGAAVSAVLAAVRELAPLRHPAQERPARPGPRRAARARPTPAITSATPGGGSWSPASGPARRWPTTGPTARTGCCGRSVFRQPTRPGTPGNRSPPATPTTWTTPGGSCMSSLTAPDGKPRSMRPGEELPCPTARIFRQRGGQHDGTDSGAASRSLAHGAGSRGMAACQPLVGLQPHSRESATYDQDRPPQAGQPRCTQRVR